MPWVTRSMSATSTQSPQNTCAALYVNLPSLRDVFSPRIRASQAELGFAHRVLSGSCAQAVSHGLKTMAPDSGLLRSP